MILCPPYRVIYIILLDLLFRFETGILVHLQIRDQKNKEKKIKCCKNYIPSRKKLIKIKFKFYNKYKKT